MSDIDFLLLAKKEINAGRNARNQGNEGKARVCARRAAGYIIDEYLHRNKIKVSGSSAILRLRIIDTLPNIDPDLKNIAAHLLVRVTPDHELPIDVDLIHEVRVLAQRLLGATL